MSDTLTDNDWCEINRTTITKMYDTLTRDIDCTKYFPSLRSTFVLTADDCDEIREERTRKKMVMKFLDLLTKKEKRTVVEELLRAIGKDKTMPQLRMKLMKAFVETKEEYKRTHGEMRNFCEIVWCGWLCGFIRKYHHVVTIDEQIDRQIDRLTNKQTTDRRTNRQQTDGQNR